jgi:hypothetical protein
LELILQTHKQMKATTSNAEISEATSAAASSRRSRNDSSPKTQTATVRGPGVICLRDGTRIVTDAIASYRNNGVEVYITLKSGREMREFSGGEHGSQQAAAKDLEAALDAIFGFKARE